MTVNLNEEGEEAVAEVNRPWLINLLVDWCQFDQMICSFTETAGNMIKIITTVTLLHIIHHCHVIIMFGVWSTKTD